MIDPMILDCPFCSSKKIKILDGSFGGVKSFQVKCISCLAKGPNATSAEEACEKWNQSLGTAVRAAL